MSTKTPTEKLAADFNAALSADTDKRIQLALRQNETLTKQALDHLKNYLGMDHADGLPRAKMMVDAIGKEAQAILDEDNPEHPILQILAEHDINKTVGNIGMVLAPLRFKQIAEEALPTWRKTLREREKRVQRELNPMGQRALR